MNKNNKIFKNIFEILKNEFLLIEAAKVLGIVMFDVVHPSTKPKEKFQNYNT